MPVANKGREKGMFIRIFENPMNTPLAEGIPWGKSPLNRGCEKLKTKVQANLTFLTQLPQKFKNRPQLTLTDDQ
jgi:hypothetical protein